MKKEKVVFYKKASEFAEEAGYYFEKHSGIDPNAVPEKFGDGVEVARNLIGDQLKIVFLYNCEEVTEVGNGKVKLGCGQQFVGKIPPIVLKNAKEEVNYVISLLGFTELHEQNTDIMADYFLDAWGTAYIEAAQAYLGKLIAAECEKEGMKRTHIWCPGQHQFAINNQKPLFAMLKPEEEGCTLTKNMMMVPIKSVSGMMGIIDKDEKDIKRPCDFCPLGNECPASKKEKCADM